MPIKQSICFPMIKPADVSLEDLFRAGKEIGYAAVELWAPGPDLESIVDLAKSLGLAVAIMSGHNSIADGFNKRSSHDRIEAELRASIDLAAKYGIPGVITFSGNRQPFMTEIEAIQACVDGIRRIAPYAEEKGINLNMELLNSKVDHAGYQADHTSWGVAVCERVNSPRVKLLYDIYHMQIMEGDVIRTVRENVKWIGHFHTAGNPGRRDMDDTQELNYTGICRAISATSYPYYVGHEFRPKGDVFAALKATFDLCNVP